MILDFKGTPIFYTDSGQGETLVLLHGFLENSSIWTPFINDLSKNNRIICIDLLGHGLSGCLGYIHSMELMAETVSAVLNHLKINRCTILGHSMGGYVALAFTEKHPDMVRGLGLANSTASADSEERKKNRDRAIVAVKENHKVFINMSIPNLFRPENKTTFAEEIKLLKTEALKMPVQGIVAALEGMKARPNREKLLHSNVYRKLMILGKKDPVLNYKELKSQIEGVQIDSVEFPDGHMSFIENRGQFLQAIMHFIE
ncbi:alpha/beta hydrolase [Hyunsoonleella sp. SJ7]|uniref:Alpha/beta hydrolase n=1 Tax=Hyunsoonleella aquatilis TaxID=2762758 RepID=A0A923HBW9_9FLAO|nr:alpha/beta hydrolase [Hyunsoonleella aquatilis]MBC3758261.1 alpha/beta hydrolase [Hyunsoonleella aquatilis]